MKKGAVGSVVLALGGTFPFGPGCAGALGDANAQSDSATIRANDLSGIGAATSISAFPTSVKRGTLTRCFSLRRKSC